MLTARPALRRAALPVVLAAAALLAGCGSSSDPAATVQEQTVDSGGAFPRTVVHDKGSTEIAQRPQRIVALDNSLVEAVVLLDRPLVGGISSYRDLEGFPPPTWVTPSPTPRRSDRSRRRTWRPSPRSSPTSSCRPRSGTTRCTTSSARSRPPSS